MSRWVTWGAMVLALLTGSIAAMSMGRGGTLMAGQDQERALATVALRVEGMT